MKVLVMGGTRFNGLALVNELVRHGHEVTTFNRGRSRPRCPQACAGSTATAPTARRCTEMMKNEDFDVVQDISGYTIDDVKPLFDAFKGRIGHYIFAGSTVIYADTKVLPIRETHARRRGPEAGRLRQEQDRRSSAGSSASTASNGFPATVMSFSMVFGPNNNIAEREQRMFMRLLQGRPVLIPGDGTTVGQIGHVDDEAKALRMVMMNPNTFGKRYNVTGKDYYTDEGYVDVVRRDRRRRSRRRCFIPAPLMDDIWNDRVSLDGHDGAAARASASRHRAADQAQSNMRFVNSLIQRLNPQLHRWNHNTVFSIDALRQDIGWEPDYTFESAVEQTYDWFRREGLDKERQYDWGWEDQIMGMIKK